MNSYLKNWTEVKQRVDLIRKANPNAKIVTTNGCFDILHAGHCTYLEQARKLGDFLIVGINSDKSVSRIKGPDRPINNENARALVLESLKNVDAVCVFEQETPVEWLNFIRPDIHTKGGDYIAEKIPEFKALNQWGGKVVCLPFVEGFSTTSIVNKIKK
jgi:rfaE bifunctional protein nucleotidyltransferase chain/domain